MQLQPTPVPTKPPGSLGEPEGPLNPQDAGFFVHPHLTPDNDPHKGRMLRSSGLIPTGTVVLVDTSYAIVPIPSAIPDTNGGTPSAPSLVCSNLACSRRTNPASSKRVICSRKCDKDVVWCDEGCRAADRIRHDFECQWLRQQGAVMRQKETNYDFITLWHVVRLLAGWYREVRTAGATWPTTSSTPTDITNPADTDTQGRSQRGTAVAGDTRFSWNWEAVLQCCDFLESWPASQAEHWGRLAQTYMMDKAVLPCPLSFEQMVSLICKEETNTFGLYPKATGTSTTASSDGPAQSRGETYGVSLYPRAAMFNHSCRPNVSFPPPSSPQPVYHPLLRIVIVCRASKE